jgi:ATP synthase F1 delta subunit
MKITVNQYAKSLYAATKDKSQKEMDGLISSLVKILAKNRQIKLSSKISKKFQEISNKENGIVEALVVSARKLDEKTLKNIESFVKDKYAAKKIVLENKIDEKIKGGMIIQIGDEILDGSIANQLKMLKNNLSK